MQLLLVSFCDGFLYVQSLIGTTSQKGYVAPQEIFKIPFCKVGFG